MPRVNFDAIDNVNEFKPIPAGKYIVEVMDVEIRQTRAGDAKWSLRMKVTDGSQRGRYVFDDIAFSTAALERLKIFLAAFSLPTSGEHDLTVDMVTGKTCQVTVYVDNYADGDGITRERNAVTFRGYEPFAGASTEHDADL